MNASEDRREVALLRLTRVNVGRIGERIERALVGEDALSSGAASAKRSSYLLIRS